MRTGAVRLVPIGLSAGFVSALFGVGGGIVVVPLLLLASAFEIRAATATSLAAIGVTAAAGVAVYAVHGEVRPLYAALVGVPAVAGVLAGAALQQRLPVRMLSFLFAGVLAAIGVRMIVR